MRPATLRLAAGQTCGRLGRGLKFFKEHLDLSFIASGVL